jgi:hypothetical protein
MCSAFSLDLSYYEGYQEYFFSRQKWFFGVMAVMFAVDLCDDYIFTKGGIYTFLESDLSFR